MSLEMGVQPKTLSRLLGHASISTTYDIYAHVIPELEDEAAKKVAEKFLGINGSPRDILVVS